MQSAETQKHDQFVRDVLIGLTSDPKFLSSKYFYDDEGSRLFQEIMKLPEYYLTRSEMEIFTGQTERIFDAFRTDENEFDLIELGAGDGTKTAVLIKYFLEMDARFRFAAIDISAGALKLLSDQFKERFPDLRIQTEQGDYFEALRIFGKSSDKRKIVLFLGSNIGNFTEEQALIFFTGLRNVMNPQDLLFIGFDLHKNPKTILNAYDDSLGVTPRFNLNLLKRINRELGGDFDLEEFRHYASYHPLERAARSFLISQKAQTVYIEAAGRSFEFRKWEPIYMEVSQKYDVGMIDGIARSSGFAVVGNFFDANEFYANSLWRPV